MHVITADQAAALLQDGDTLLIGGSGSGHAVPDALMEAVARRFGKEGHPRGITSLHPTGLGDRARRGVGHFALPGLLKRIVCGTLTDAPLISGMALRDEVEAYSMPQGVTSQLMREMAAGRPGLITRTGLHTFVDPRLGGGRQSPSAQEDLSEIVTLGGEDYIWFKPHRIDVCFLRGTTADEDGNISMEQEAVFLEMTSMAQAAHNQGAPVVVQVKRIARAGTLPAKTVKIPGMLVDFVVVESGQWQTYETEYSPAYAGELKIPLTDIPRLPLDERKVIARRATLELHAGAVCNLGSGIATGIANVAAEEDALDAIVLTNEQGMIGGAPAGGNEAGAARNMAAMIDQPYQFDFYDGGGLDLAFLSFVEADSAGNINVSRFEGRITGIGGFVNISQGARKVVFCGTFTAGGLDIGVGDGRLDIRRDGRVDKLVAKVTQLSYSGGYAAEQGREMMLVTERAVFRLERDGLVLTEIAPGVDLERDVLARMGFRPRLADTIATMDAACFTDAPMGLRARVESRRAPHRSARVQAWREARGLA